MNTSKFKFTLNLHKTQSQISLPVTRGDTARTLFIGLSDGAHPYFIGDGCLAKLEILRPTGTRLEAFCPIENNATVVYEFSQNENTAAVEGIHDCAVVLYDADGHRIGSPRFTMIVSDRVLDTDDIELSDDDVSAVDAMIADEIVRRNAESQRSASETARRSKEAERVSAEAERAAAEAARQSAENARAATELARANAEGARALAEESRALAENDRALAENQRSAAENSRAEAENLRKSVAQSHAAEEALRAQNEAARSEAERERAETERNRREAEAQRAAEENARARAENERVTAERGRQQRFDEQIDNMLPDVTAEDEGNVMIVAGGAWVPKKIAGIEDIQLSVEMDANGVVTILLTNSRGDVLASGSVDLPLESVIVGGREENGKLIFDLQSGSTLEVEIGSLINGLVSQETFDGHTHKKSEITDFPTAMAPTAHHHTQSEITDFPSTMTPSAHSHPTSEISDFPTSMEPTKHTHTKSEISDFPTEMTPTTHMHDAFSITAGTFAGKVVANSSGQAYNQPLIRNSRLSSAEETPGINGEICWQYE